MRKVITHFMFASTISLFCTNYAAAVGEEILLAEIITQTTETVMQLSKQLDQLKKTHTDIANATKKVSQTHEAFTGGRGLGEIFNNPALKKQLPADWQHVYENVTHSDYFDLGKAAEAIIKDEQRLTNKSLSERQKALESRQATKATYDKAMSQHAYDAARERLQQINNLMKEINKTQDPKAIMELQARLAVEQTAIQNEQTKLQLISMLQQAETKLIEQQNHELGQKIFSNKNATVPRF